MSTHVNEPRYRKGWTTRDGKTKQGFWYVFFDGKKLNLTSKYGAPNTSKTKRDKSAALDARARYMSDLSREATRDNLLGRTRVVTVRQVIDLYKKEVWPNSSDGWRDTSAWFFRLFCDGHDGKQHNNNPRKIEPYVGWGDKPAESITHDDIREWCSHHEWNKSGSRNAVMVLKAAYNHAVKIKLIQGNPIEKFPTQRNTHPDVQWFETDSEEKQYRQAAEARCPAYALFWSACLATGARPSELARAQKRHVKTTASGRYYIRLDEHKTAKKTGKPRIIHLPNGPNGWQDWIAKRLPECDPCTHLFETERGCCWKKCNWISWNLAVLKNAMLDKKLTLYSCRHTYITRALLKQVGSKIVADLCGTSTKQIDDTYGHLLEMGDAMGDIVDGLAT